MTQTTGELDEPALAQPALPQHDGRRQRREQNRDSVIDALVALFRDGRYQPSSAEIAATAGLSPRSLFRYFEDVDNLHRAAVDRLIEELAPLAGLPGSPCDPTETKIKRLVAARIELFEHSEPAAWALRSGAHHDDLLTALLHDARALLLSHITELFEQELAGLPDAVLPAVDVLCSFESWHLLRRVSGLSPAGVSTTLVTALRALLAGKPSA